jgi:5-methylcytosine-specific restriction endonuclease McrA
MPASLSAIVRLPAFSPDQPAAVVDASLKEALTACDRARHCAVTWFAEVKRRALHRELGYPSLQVYATQALGFTDNRYWQFARLADDLERLPALRQALDDGRLGWTKAQQVARVATARTQEAWIAKAATSGRRELELALAPAQVSATTQVSDPEPAPPQAADTVPGALTLRGDALRLARFEALLEKAHKLRAVPAGSDRLDVVLAGLEAMVAEAGTNAAPNEPCVAPHYQVIIHQCPDCATAAAVTLRGELPLTPALAHAVRCDARVREGAGPNRATIPPSVRAAVLARDRHRCATIGCGATRFLEVHHVVPRLRGGSNRAENLLTLCSRCHGFAHERVGAAGLAPAQVSEPAQVSDVAQLPEAARAAGHARAPGPR